MTPLETAKTLFNSLIAAGTTIEGACAILGNVQAESGLSSNNLDALLGESIFQYARILPLGEFSIIFSTI